MKKLKLELETLSVESFETIPPPEQRGTILGRASTACSPLDTCEYSCLDPASCAGTCDCTGGFCPSYHSTC
ncbi:MAG TPA: hypothetical protein VFX98_06420 [Longimicrobiaceae bacterium]|nr:hypothetical protein [Longimicrobiaceae bacterium]